MLWATLGEVRKFEDSDKARAHLGFPQEVQGEADYGLTQQQGEAKAGGMAIGTLSRILTVLHLMYQVEPSPVDSTLHPPTARPRPPFRLLPMPHAMQQIGRQR